MVRVASRVFTPDRLHTRSGQTLDSIVRSSKGTRLRVLRNTALVLSIRLCALLYKIYGRDNKHARTHALVPPCVVYILLVEHLHG